MSVCAHICAGGCGGSSECCQGTIAKVQAREADGLDQGGWRGMGEKWLDPTYPQEIESMQLSLDPMWLMEKRSQG